MELQGIEVSKNQVNMILKKEMKLSFIKVKKLHPNANTIRAKILRQQYAIAMLKLLESGKRIINIDETWLNETSFVRRVWAHRGGYGNMRLNPIMPRLSMIAALDTHGNVWFTLTHASTDSDIIALFFKHLVASLDSETPDWQDDTVFLWDNATYHASSETMNTIKRLGL